MQYPETPTAVRDGGSGGGKRGPLGTVGEGIVDRVIPGGSSGYPASAGGGGGGADGGDYGFHFSGPVGMDYFKLLQEPNSNIVEVVEEEVIQQDQLLTELAEAAAVVAADMQETQQKMDLLIEVAVAEVKSRQISMVV